MNKIFGLFLACSFALAAHGAIPFVSGNKTLLKAATGENSTPSEELAFTELANYVKEVFGATLERGEPKNSGIIIATLASKNIPPAVREKLSASKMDDSFYLKTADGLGVGIGIYRPEFSPDELYQSAKEFMSK